MTPIRRRWVKRSISAIADAAGHVAGAFRPAPHIRHAEVQGCTVILDLRNQTYQVLDDVGSVIWQVLTGTMPADGLAALTRKYDVTLTRLDADAQAFAEKCVAGGLLVPGTGAQAPSFQASMRQSPPLNFGCGVVSALASTLATRLFLARHGFARTYAAWMALPAGADRHGLERAVLAFSRAENFVLSWKGTSDCLPRSLALYHFLCGCGVAAEHCIGVVRFPFQAHAWVECGGQPVLDGRARDLGMVAVARIGTP
jgi:Transglutaminase-like superfamily/Coenzyme PQQ synthesis protein D (PqqD)